MALSLRQWYNKPEKKGRCFKMDPVNLTSCFKAIIDTDRAAVVVCDLLHNIIYMNPAADKYYGKHGGSRLVGQSIFDCHNANSRETIEKVVNWFREDNSHQLMYTYHNEKQNKDVYMVALRNEQGELIGYYEKHEYRNPETMKMYDFT
jgi:PAS domain S-box-containing protein